MWQFFAIETKSGSFTNFEQKSGSSMLTTRLINVSLKLFTNVGTNRFTEVAQTVMISGGYYTSSGLTLVPTFIA